MAYLKYGPHRENLPAKIRAEFERLLIEISRDRSTATQAALPTDKQEKPAT
jgi:hypothetical protein